MKASYREMFEEVRASERLKEEVMNMTKQERTQVVKKVSVSFIIAAALAVILAGTALAAVIGVPETLQEWFGKQWTEAGGGEMPKEQSEVIESLVQPVGVTCVNKGISITLDSVTPGESGLWMLYKVKGMEEAEPEEWFFKSYDLTGNLMENEIIDESFGVSVRTSNAGNVGVMEDGTQVFLMMYDAPKGVNFLEGGDLEFRLEDISVWKKTNEKKMETPVLEVEARWILPFTLAPTDNLQVLTVKSAEVPCEYSEWDEGPRPDPIKIHDIRVTAMGVSFIEPAWKNEDEREYVTMDVAVCLKGGMEISLDKTNFLGVGNPGEVCTRNWTLPVDIAKVESIRFGDMVIPLEQPKK